MKILFIIIWFFLHQSTNAQNETVALFNQKGRQIVITVSNQGADVLKLPNSIRSLELKASMFEIIDGSVLVLRLTHDSEGPLVTTQHGTIVEKGILAFEKIQSGDTKQYSFKMPRKFRKKSNLITTISLILEDQTKITFLRCSCRSILRKN